MKTFLILYGKPRYLGFLKIDEDLALKKGDPVVVETARGRELAVVAGPLSTDQEERYRRVPSGEQGESGQKANMPTEEVGFIGFPLPDETDGKEERRCEESTILMKAREMLKTHNLAMKLVDVEYLLDRSKLSLLLHGRAKDRFPRICPGPREGIQDPYRTSADRRAG